VLRCQGCRKQADSAEEALRWRAFITVADEGASPEVVVYCPDCAVREFGDDDPQSGRTQH
jgi:hypothetical protein